ncbi:hypothetical protein [Tropicibacter sp. Alg240-R139]|uniref:hypothetical protein n=1 Tax=Tropicibacter sp. Alg240-R139 TaxID=2305991 RepID=UPI0013DE7EFF|nr:hypothetical protein [Tropicibacter sp. Alg240-R139]
MRVSSADTRHRQWNGSSVRTPVIALMKVLRDERRSGLVKLRCSTGHLGERQLWAES